MKASLIPVLVSISLFLPACFSFTPPAITGKKLDPAAISRLFGSPVGFDETTGVVKLILPRSDLNVIIDGVRVTPALGLKARATLTGTTEQAILLGDLPLLQSEVDPVLQAAIEAGLEVTALHNTFLLDNPRVMSLHITGKGTQENLAKAAGTVFKKLSEKIPAPREKETAPLLDPARSTLDLQTMEALLWKGQQTEGVFRVSLGRGTQLNGEDVGEAEGINSWAAFAGTPEHAVANGDIATLESELRPLLQTLIRAHIHVVSIHTHLTREVPKLVFVHFWGTGPVKELAAGVKTAIQLKEEFQSQ